MRVYELMDQLAKMPAGAEVKTSIYVEERMEIFREETERALHARVDEVYADCADDVYLGTADVEV